MTVLVAADFFLLDIAFTQVELFANLLAGSMPFVSVSTEPNCQIFPLSSANLQRDIYTTIAVQTAL